MTTHSLLIFLLALLLAPAEVAIDTCPLVPDPWSLAIGAEKLVLQPGKETEIEFRLRNLSSDAIHACICTMEIGFKSAIETPGLLRGNVSGGNCLANHDFILPARATLLWAETVKVTEGSSGKGSISAYLHICSEPDPAGASDKVWQVSAESAEVTYSKE